MAKKLRADQKNYKKAFQRHADTYEKYINVSKSSRSLILCYCVECGLKCLVMKNNKLYKVETANEEIKNVLGTHDIRVLLNEVKQADILFLILVQNMGMLYQLPSIIRCADMG